MLKPKQQRFVDEYLIDLNATAAAKRTGYSERTAYSIGQELLKKPEIAEAIEKAKAERAERTRIDADWLLRRLADEAVADMADLYDASGNLKPIADWPLIWRQGLVAGIESATEKAGDEAKDVTVVRKVKLTDRGRRLELIGRHIDVQAFRDRVEFAGKVNVTTAPQDEDL
jgi:phage terminase small subunit